MIKNFFGPSNEPANQNNNLQILQIVSRLAHSIRRGFDRVSAREIALAASEVLDAEAVAVTEDDEVLAIAGSYPKGFVDVVQTQAAVVLERRRIRRPTLYEASLGGGPVEVAIAVLTADGVPRGTLHVLPKAGVGSEMNELRVFAEVVSSQLELAEVEQARAYAAEAELRSLRAQVSPHFIHNVLTAIASLIRTNPDRARSLITVMASFLRSNFRTQTELTSVAEELKLVEQYIELEKARFEDRYVVTLRVAPESLPVRLPYLTLQPIVENAFRHGLEKMPGPGKLSIVAENAGPEILIHIEDNGVGTDPDKLEEALAGTGATPHVGILAVDTRLRSQFGPEYGLTISTNRNAGTTVTIRLPK